MKEIELNEKDYSTIKDRANSEFVNSPAKYEYGNFVCKCIIKAFLTFLNHKDYVIRKGKIFESSSYEAYIAELEQTKTKEEQSKRQIESYKLENSQLIKELQVLARKVKDLTPPPKPMIKRD